MQNQKKPEYVNGGRLEYGEDGTQKFTQLPKGYTPTLAKINRPIKEQAKPAGTGYYTDYKNVPDSAPEDTERYSRVPSADVMDEPNIDTIREEKRKQAQTIIDNINAQYNRVLTGDREYAKGLENRARALNISGGLGGSDFATASAVKAEEKGKAVIRNTEAERDAKVNAVLADVEADSEEVYQTRRKQFLEEAESAAEADKAFLDEQKSTALTRMADLAASVPLNTFKQGEPEIYKKLLAQSGLSGLEFDSKYNKLKELSEQLKYDYMTLEDGSLMRIDDKGGREIVGNYSPPEKNAGWTIAEQSDGSLYWVKKDENDTIYEWEKVEEKEEGYTLGEGQARYDAEGNVISKNLKTTAPGSGSKKDDDKYDFSSSNRSRLIGAGLSNDDVSAIQENINNGYSLDEIFESNADISEEQQTVIRNVMSGVTATQESKQGEPKFKSQQEVYSNFSDDLENGKPLNELLSTVEKEGFDPFSNKFFSLTERAILNQIENDIKNGKTEKEIKKNLENQGLRDAEIQQFQEEINKAPNKLTKFLGF